VSASLAFSPVSRRAIGRYTAVRGQRRYLIEYRHRLGSWTATVSAPDGSIELGRAETLDGAQQLAQRHARGRK
jgi:hypothetical protein